VTQPPVPEQPAVGETPNLTDEELAKLAEQGAKTEVITVTGSLIGRKEVDSPSPISVVDRERMDDAGITNVGDILQKIPSQGNAINSQNNNGGDGSTRIDLRSLGSARTLVLMNGRRLVPSGLGADASVDLGTIPLAMIERVEVLKDGASAIYGSDAIAGVVNIITKSNFNGTEASIYTATTQKGDGTNYDLSFVSGHSSQKGNITFSGGFQNQDPVMAGSRGFASKTYTYNFACTDANAALPTTDPNYCIQRTFFGSQSGPTGKINTKVAGFPVSVPGCTSKFCTADGKGGFRDFIAPKGDNLGDNYNFQPLNYIQTPSQRINLFSNGQYALSKHSNAYFEAQFNSRKSTQQLAEEPLSIADSGADGVVLSKDSIYNPFGADIIDYHRRLTEFGPRTFNQQINTSRLVVGVNGNIPEDVPVVKNWRWDANYNYGRTDGTQASTGSLIVSHLANALGPSFMDPAKGPQCGTPSAPIGGGCVPFSVLTPNTATQDMINYLTFTGTRSGNNQQQSAQLTTSGKLVDLPNHGDISLAVGGDFRQLSGADQPDPLTSTGDTTGNQTAPTSGSYNAYEGFAELSIVPVSGLNVLKWVELDAAARAFKYSTFGSGVTGKVSGLIRTAGGVAVRGTYGTAFRAPNIGELYSGQSDSFPAVIDPCDVSSQPSPNAMAQCAKQGVPADQDSGTVQQRTRVGGNPGLQPEHASVGTAGVVYEPLAGLDFTLDYWRIQIDQAIATLPVDTLLGQCYENGIQQFCDLIKRDPGTHNISSISDTIQNVGSRSTSGLDFSAAYSYRVKGAGTFRHAVEGTYLFKQNLDTGTKENDGMTEHILHGRGNYDLGVNPDIKFNVFTQWSHPSGVSAGFNARFVDGFKECQGGCNTTPEPPTDGSPPLMPRHVSAYATGDLFFNYALKSRQGTTQIAVGVNNVINAQPAIIYTGGALNSDESAYDFLGRFLYIRLGQSF